MDLILLFNHCGPRSSHIIISCGIKLLSTFRILLLKVSTFLLAFLACFFTFESINRLSDNARPLDNIVEDNRFAS